MKRIHDVFQALGKEKEWKEDLMSKIDNNRKEVCCSLFGKGIVVSWS